MQAKRITDEDMNTIANKHWDYITELSATRESVQQALVMVGGYFIFKMPLNHQVICTMNINYVICCRLGPTCPKGILLLDCLNENILSLLITPFPDQNLRAR